MEVNRDLTPVQCLNERRGQESLWHGHFLSFFLETVTRRIETLFPGVLLLWGDPSIEAAASDEGTDATSPNSAPPEKANKPEGGLPAAALGRQEPVSLPIAQRG